MRADAPSGANTGDRRACPLRPLRIRGRMFLRSADTELPLHVADETNSEHGANFLWAPLACQKSFDCEPFATEGAAGTASELVWTETAAGCRLGMGTVGCIVTSREARTAASIAARTLLARRVRFTNGRSTLTPVVRTCDLAVGPRASSRTTHARPMPVKIAPAVEFTHCHREAPRAASNIPGMIRRHSHKWLGQTTMHSKSRK